MMSSLCFQKCELIVSRRTIFILPVIVLALSAFYIKLMPSLQLVPRLGVLPSFRGSTEVVNEIVSNSKTPNESESDTKTSYRNATMSRELNNSRPLTMDKNDTSDTNRSRNSTEHYKRYAIQMKRILWYIRPNYVPQSAKGELRPLKACPDLPCKETSDKELISQADAVIFDVHKHVKQLPQKHPNQVWVFYSQEPPNHIKSNLKSSMWSNVFNWTCSYRRDSDIWMPYGLLENRASQPQKDYDRIVKRKTKMASWIVSSCNTPSKRREYTRLLEENGIKTDIFGRCGKRKFPRTIDGHNTCRNISTGEYSFYLSFENALCKDYVTEKLFDYYNEDIILVVRGGKGNYKQYPSGTFINIDDFKNVSELASYMKELHNNKTRYIEFLKHKDAYKAVEETFSYKLPNSYRHTHYHYLSEPMCDMCRKLLKGESKPQVYKDIHSWFHRDACHPPRDLK